MIISIGRITTLQRNLRISWTGSRAKTSIIPVGAQETLQGTSGQTPANLKIFPQIKYFTKWVH